MELSVFTIQISMKTELMFMWVNEGQKNSAKFG